MFCRAYRPRIAGFRPIGTSPGIFYFTRNVNEPEASGGNDEVLRTQGISMVGMQPQLMLQ